MGIYRIYVNSILISFLVRTHAAAKEIRLLAATTMTMGV